MNMVTIDIGKDFCEVPLGRYAMDGPFSGERFREEYLLPALRDNKKVIVVIDNTEGFGSSFLDEAFGGLVRDGNLNEQGLREVLKIELTDQDFSMYRDLIWKYISEASAKKKSA
jgi:hypothetical protein